MDFPELFGLLLLVVAVWWWLDGLRARDAAVSAAREACAGLGLQLLDDTVAVSSHRFARDEGGRLCLQRVFGFEYSDTGDNRRDGHLTMQGEDIVSIYTGPVLLKDIGD
ncbi:MAG: DUF3301 domain-containing protein [Rhodocyclaceae bacterium]|nr:DUF3301 domain-containing protein [Rhodocyclaceae bacterium]